MFDIWIETEFGNFGHFKDLLIFMKDEKLNKIDVIYSDCFFVKKESKTWTIKEVEFIVNN